MNDSTLKKEPEGAVILQTINKLEESRKEGKRKNPCGTFDTGEKHPSSNCLGKIVREVTNHQLLPDSMMPVGPPRPEDYRQETTFYCNECGATFADLPSKFPK